MGLYDTISNLLSVFKTRTVSSSSSSYSTYNQNNGTNYNTSSSSSGNALGINGRSLEQFPAEVYYHNELRPELRFFNAQLLKEYTPDVTGYVLAFMVPPPMVGFTNKSDNFQDYFSKISCFAAIDFTPPSGQITAERVQARSGGIPVAIEASPSEQITVTYIDDMDMNIYNYHLCWYYYTKELVEGIIEPPGGDFLNYDSNIYGALDYAGSCYLVKYDPSMSVIRYVGKAVGIFPQLMPSREMLGARTNNELAMIPFTYYCGYYFDTVTNQSLFNELDKHLQIYT